MLQKHRKIDDTTNLPAIRPKTKAQKTAPTIEDAITAADEFLYEEEADEYEDEEERGCGCGW